MFLDAKLIFRSFSPGRAARAISSLDKSTSIIVSVCWLAALVTLIVAIFAVHGAASSTKEAEKAMSVEPVLPAISSSPIPPREIKLIADRIQRQFPEITIEIRQGQTLKIGCNDGDKFHEWITALSYIDTLVPQYRWTLREFCTGKCSGGQLMSAVVSGQKMAMSAPHK